MYIQLYTFNSLKFYYKYIHNQSSTYFNSIEIFTRTEFHNYNIRPKDNIHVNITKYKCAENCTGNQLPKMTGKKNFHNYSLPTL